MQTKVYPYNIKYKDGVLDDIKELPDEALSELAYYINQYKINPYSCSQPLVKNLKDCRKTYIANTSYRIVIRIEDNTIKIVEIVAIGKRENKEVYLTAASRLN